MPCRPDRNKRKKPFQELKQGRCPQDELVDTCYIVQIYPPRQCGLSGDLNLLDSGVITRRKNGRK